MSLQGFAGESKEEDQLQSLKAALMEQKLIVRDGFVTEFGTAVSMDPILNRAVVGARSSRDGGSLSGWPTFLSKIMAIGLKQLN